MFEPYTFFVLSQVYRMLKSFDDSQFADSLSPTTISDSSESVFNDQEQFVSVSNTVCV